MQNYIAKKITTLKISQFFLEGLKKNKYNVGFDLSHSYSIPFTLTIMPVMFI